jgi:[ribosomal protein S5]-alanine N-acetyltransferase
MEYGGQPDRLRQDVFVDVNLQLRAFQERDLPFLDRLSVDPEAVGPFMWSGFDGVRRRRHRWENDGYVGEASVALAITLSSEVDDAPAGLASWQINPRHQPGVCYEVGVMILPEHRGKGFGLAAHKLLVRHLFDFTPAHRLEAVTDAENVPEQRALERVGFILEGRRREVYFRSGSWRDELMYGLLRSDRQDSRQ